MILMCCLFIFQSRNQGFLFSRYNVVQGGSVMQLREHRVGVRQMWMGIGGLAKSLILSKAVSSSV